MGRLTEGRERTADRSTQLLPILTDQSTTCRECLEALRRAIYWGLVRCHVCHRTCIGERAAAACIVKPSLQPIIQVHSPNDEPGGAVCFLRLHVRMVWRARASTASPKYTTIMVLGQPSPNDFFSHYEGSSRVWAVRLFRKSRPCTGDDARIFGISHMISRAVVYAK